MAHPHMDAFRGEEWHTHTYMNIHECSRKGANHPGSTPERNGTHTQECSRNYTYECTMTTQACSRTDTHDPESTLERALGRTQTSICSQKDANPPDST